jgi:small subunit ribosomal protein S4
MSNRREQICRQCRVEKTKLLLKGDKCLSAKCPVERRAYAPGEHGKMRRRILGYAIQLREKQKLKRYYGMTEKQFRLFFERAERRKGVTGENLLSMLERRLDNVVTVMGFARSRVHARQLIGHGHFLVNDHKVSIPSYEVDAGDVIRFRPRSVSTAAVKDLLESLQSKTVPSWIEVDRAEARGRIKSLPTRADVTLPVEEHLVVELYSK